MRGHAGGLHALPPLPFIATLDLDMPCLPRVVASWGVGLHQPVALCDTARNRATTRARDRQLCNICIYNRLQIHAFFHIPRHGHCYSRVESEQHMQQEEVLAMRPGRGFGGLDEEETWQLPSPASPEDQVR